MRKDTYTTDDSNIETVSLSELTAKQERKVIDVDLVEMVSDRYETLAQTLHMAGSTMKQVTGQMVKTAGLENINFTASAEKNNLGDILMRNPADIPPVVLSGKDEEYDYEIVAHIRTINGTPEITAAIYRTADGNPMDGFWVFDFQNRKWRILNYANFKGYTQRQMALITKEPDSAETIFLRLCRTQTGILSDVLFEELYKKNEPILKLFDSTKLFTSLGFNWKTRSAFLAPLKNDAVEGMTVVYKDGVYCLNAVSYGRIVETVMITESMAEIEKTLSDMLDRKFYPDSVAIVPLSPDSAISIRDNGKFEYISNNQTIPPEEEIVFQKYLLCKASAEKELKNQD